MWGKSSHVIMGGAASNLRVYEPRRIETGNRAVSKVECGAWHAVAITGRPAWSKHNNESDVDDEEEDDELITVVDADSSSSVSEDGCVVQQQTLRREKTMTIAEFYAPTPAPRQVHTPSPDTMWMSSSRPASKHTLPPVRPASRKAMQPNDPLLTVTSNDWRPDESHQDVEIFLPDCKSDLLDDVNLIESVEETQNKRPDSGRFSVTFFMKEGPDGKEECILPSGAQEESLPGNRKAVTFEVSNEESRAESLPPASTSFTGASRKLPGNNLNRNPLFYGQDGATIQGGDASHFSRTLAEQFYLPRQATSLNNKKLELRTANTFIIDKNWDMYNTHLKGGSSASTTVSAASSKTNCTSSSPTWSAPDTTQRPSRAGGSPKRGSQAPLIALQRSKSVLVGGSGASSSAAPRGRQSGRGVATEKPLPGRAKQQESKMVAVTDVQRCLKNPATISFIGPPDPLPHSGGLRTASIPTGRGQRSQTILSLGMEKPRARPRYSSASSWKSNKDRDRLRGTPNGKAPEAEDDILSTTSSARDTFHSPLPNTIGKFATQYKTRQPKRAKVNITIDNSVKNNVMVPGTISSCQQAVKPKTFSTIGTTGSVLSELVGD